MAEQFTGMVEILDSAENVTIMLDGDSGDISAGGNGQAGDFIIKNAAGEEILRINGDEGDITIWREIGGVQREVMKFDASHAALYLGCEGNEGDIIIRNNAGDDTFKVDGNQGDIFVWRMIGGVQRQVMKFDASHAALYLGSEGNEGDIIIRNNAGDDTFKVDGNEGDIFVWRMIGGVKREVMKFDASRAALYVGSEGNEGDIIVRDGDGTDVFHFDSSHAALYLGAAGNEGDIIIRNNAGDDTFKVDGNEGDIFVWRMIGGVKREVMKFDASHAALYLGSEGNEGDIIVRDGNGIDVFRFDARYAVLDIGGEGNEGDIRVRDNSGDTRIHLDGNTGDIKLSGADCAEEFDVVESETIDPGTVLTIDDDSKLRPCDKPYDRRVAGVVSGGNGSNPGIILDRNPAQSVRLPVALNGKVYCKVDAQYSPIEVGDLLTTSATPGHAMKADDPMKAFGAVIGKTLRGLEEGRGLIPILVSLQ